MSDNTKSRFYSRLFFNVYKYYAILIIVFAVLLGYIYLNLYQNASVDEYKDQVIRQAEIASVKMNEYIRYVENDNASEAMEFIILYREIIGGGVSTISKPDAKNPMLLDYQTLSYNVIVDLYPDEVRMVVDNAFEGNSPIVKTYYNEGGSMISGAVQIIGKNGEICGAVLISFPMEVRDIIAERSFSMILISSLVAAFISIIIASIFVRNLTRPILKMRNTAIKLSEGKYETKTEINRNDEIGELAKTIDFLTDKLQENEQVRNNLEQMRLDFFANVSHELRTPITVMRAYTESLYDGVVTNPEKVRQYYDRMMAECKSMERLVGDLLLLSKMQNPDFKIDKEPVNLIQIFDEIIRGIKVISEEKLIFINFSKEKDVYMLYGDYDRLRQMFLVILDNALKFSPTNSTIYITLWQDDKIYVSIKDEGIGISEEEQSYIFEKFYKSKLKQNEKGSGLGLSIAKQIANKHNGDIELKSETGKGTEFIFSFNNILDEELEQADYIDGSKKF